MKGNYTALEQTGMCKDKGKTKWPNVPSFKRSIAKCAHIYGQLKSLSKTIMAVPDFTSMCKSLYLE